MAKKPTTLTAQVTRPPDQPAPVPIQIAGAIKAMHRGDASGHQQQIALDWIIREACGKSYFPYHQSDRDTVFALGKLFVADQIVGLINADLSTLRSGHVPEEVPVEKR